MREAGTRDRRRPRLLPWLLTGVGVGVVAVLVWLDAAPTPTHVPRAPAGRERGAEVAESVKSPAASPVAKILEGVDLSRFREGGGVMGLIPEPSDAVQCDEERTERLRPIIKEIAGGEIFVDEEEWQRRSVSSQVGLSNWMSKCISAGLRVRIHGVASRDLLAVYDPDDGYQTVN